MKTAIKLILFYLAFQILAAVAVAVPGAIYSIVKYGDVDNVSALALVPTMLLSFVFMGLYLWKAGYISTDRETWSPVSAKYLTLTAIIGGASILLVDWVYSLMPWLPDIMEHTFDMLQSDWLGVLCIAVLGPIMEELIFRGAITRALLQKYTPTRAIIISALLFGIFHINPAQIVAGILIGLLLAWVYYKTASLVPCILIHIINNSLAVYLGKNYPDVDTMQELFPGNTYYIGIAVAAIVFIGAFLLMNRTTVPYPWKKEVVDQN